MILELRQYIKQTIKFDHKIGISKLDGNAFVIRALTKMEEDGNALVVICVNWIRKHLWNMVEINFKKKSLILIKAPIFLLVNFFSIFFN